MEKKSWGGKRVGAGRKSADDAAIIGTVTLSVDQETHDLLLREGDGNLSLGLRRIALAAKNTGGHCNPITAPAAGEVVKSTGGPRYKHTGAAGGERVVHPPRGVGHVVKKPVLRVVPERNPETGARYSIPVHMRLEREAREEYEAALLAYHAASGQR